MEGQETEKCKCPLCGQESETVKIGFVRKMVASLMEATENLAKEKSTELAVVEQIRRNTETVAKVFETFWM